MPPLTFNSARLRAANTQPIRSERAYVLYWCQMFRRLSHNHALDHALKLARELKKPLVIYEALKRNYPWANVRFHQFMLEGMQDNLAAAKAIGATYWPFVATPENDGRGLVRKLCESACVLITDDYPQFIIPAHTQAVAGQVDCAVVRVDGNSMVPLSLLGPPTAAAAHLRPKWHKLFAEAWQHRAEAQPDFSGLPKAPKAPFRLWTPPKNLAEFIAGLGVDASVLPVPGISGGATSGRSAIRSFVKDKLARYAEGRNGPDDPAKNAASGLSAHLHYGHIGIQEVVEAVLGEHWTTAELDLKTRNKDGFFGKNANINSFLDEAITWRDVGFQWNFARTVKQGHQSTTRDAWPAFNFESRDFSPLSVRGTLEGVLPVWAWASLKKHSSDRREYLYTLEQLENADTHDQLWNAAQLELIATGRIHNYLRMLWGKKILEWTESPEQAYRIMEHLNNKYALDGRDPNSYTGILWCFGLFDRPWAPERKVFGTIRYMSSDNTAKKFKLAGYFDYVRRVCAPRVASASLPASVQWKHGYS